MCVNHLLCEPGTKQDAKTQRGKNEKTSFMGLLIVVNKCHIHYKITILTILNVQVSGINYIHNAV